MLFRLLFCFTNYRFLLKSLKSLKADISCFFCFFFDLTPTTPSGGYRNQRRNVDGFSGFFFNDSNRFFFFFFWATQWINFSIGQLFWNIRSACGHPTVRSRGAVTLLLGANRFGIDDLPFWHRPGQFLRIFFKNWNLRGKLTQNLIWKKKCFEKIWNLFE